MPNITIRGIPEQLYQDIKRLSEKEHRSINSQILYGIADYVSRTKNAERIIKEIQEIHADIDVKGFELSPLEMKKIIDEGRP